MNFLRKIAARGLNYRNFHASLTRNDGIIMEPAYLDDMKAEQPTYEALNIQLRGYDFPVLESYQKFIHNLLNSIDIDVADAWATPHQDLQVNTLKPKSDVVNAQYNLKVYERTVHITNLLATQLPLILRTLEASAPAGVTVQLLNHEQWHEDIRYVPDTELKALKQELDDLGGPLIKKKS